MRGPAIAPALLAWYHRRKRDLPWRRTRDPYAIWVSEVMLQQTRVEVVDPYYRRFLAAFPTLASLARAPVDRVLALWSGLGYYGRARNLHGAVRECRARYRGRVPRDPEEFGGLPGVGPYTRAAVLSIAYGVPLGVVDGNVIRVVARLCALDGDPKGRALRVTVEEFVARALPDDTPGDFNQALMELGATVCTPRSPACGECPLALGCQARRAGTPERWPRPAARARVRRVEWEAAVIERRGRVLLLKRGLRGRWRGMWELPWSETSLALPGGDPGVALELGEPIGRLRHSVLDERIEVRVRRAKLRGRPRRAHAWVRPGDIGDYALASVWKKALALALGPPPDPS